MHRRSRTWPTRGLLLAVIGALVLGVSAGPAQARVPKGWIGAMMDGPLSNPTFNSDREIKVMASSGVESVRATFFWYQQQPFSNPGFVKPEQKPFFRLENGVATTYTDTDLIVRRAAQRGLSVMPNVFQAPSWLRKQPNVNGSPPKDPATFARYMTGMVKRYGPRGSFWAENPKLPKVPIRRWQIWNEPDFAQNWREAKWQVGYANLLKAAYPAIKAQDRGAKVVLAGIANDSPRTIAKLYTVKGVGKYFDYVAIHPYTASPEGVITLIKSTRKVMAKHGGRKKGILLSEFGWPSSVRKKYGFETTEKGQASRLKTALPLLAKNRRKLRIAAIYYYTWIRNVESRKSGEPFDYAGLRRFKKGSRTVIQSKPAYKTFKAGALKLEGCKKKGSLATTCAKKR